MTRVQRLALGTGLLLLVARSAGAVPSADCLTCHAEPSLTTERVGRQVSLHVEQKVVRGSVHASLECTDCHAGLDPSNLPHSEKPRSVDCAGCHGDTSQTHAFHASVGTVSCARCHGTHDVKPPAEPGGRFAHGNLSRFCGTCHGGIALEFTASEHGKALATDAKGAPDCLLCHRHPLTHGRENNVAERKLAQEKLCLSCHLDNADVRAGMGPSVRFIEAYEKSVHGSAVLSGKGAAANCVNCHGSHQMRAGMDPNSRTNKSHIPETCAECHGEIAWEYARSVHGVALESGKAESPVCTDCHGEHNIYPHDDPRSPVAAANVSAKVCTPCHSSLKLSEKYEIAADRSKSYADSYHGLAQRGGSVEAANCASCHGSHDIRPSSDPASRIHKANLATTCGKCHPGANERFAVGSVHVVIAKGEEPILYWIATAYIGMIVFTVGGMLFHNLLDFLRKLRHKLQAHRNGVREEEIPHNLYVRMTLAERLQHGALLVSFIVLAVTGFMLRYPEAWWVVYLRQLSDRLFEWRSLLHRIAAVVMVAASVIHIGYVSFNGRGRRLILDLVPGRRDVYDAWGVLRYNLGFSGHKPQFGRFSYIEKSEYWALVWGTIVMALTGGILWFDNTFMGILTKLGSDIARTIHFYEAVLATLAILVWHIYYVVFNPDTYPMNFAWLTGMVTEREMAEEHPLELAALKRAAFEEARKAQSAAEAAVAAERAEGTGPPTA